MDRTKLIKQAAQEKLAAARNKKHGTATDEKAVAKPQIPYEEYVASASSDLTIKLWEARTGRCLLTMRGHDNWI